MKIIVVSPQTAVKDEIDTVTSLFEAGLDLLHVRKPGYSKKRIENYIQKIPKKYWNKIVIHSHHTLALKYKLKGIHLTRKHRKKEFITALKVQYLKFFKSDITISATYHNLANIYENVEEFDYVFLSPIFDSISKSGYQSGFNFHSLKVAMSKTSLKVIAIGGIELNRLDKIQNLGFSGIALAGTIWQSNDRINDFLAIKEKCKNLETAY